MNNLTPEEQRKNRLEQKSPLMFKRALKLIMLEAKISEKEHELLLSMVQDQDTDPELQLKIIDVLNAVAKGAIVLVTHEKNEVQDDKTEEDQSAEQIPTILEGAEEMYDPFSLQTLSKEEAYILATVLSRKQKKSTFTKDVEHVAEQVILPLKNIPEQNLYRTFYLTKSDGRSKRRVDEPHKDLRHVQKMILQSIFKGAKHEDVYSYQKDRSPLTAFKEILEFCKDEDLVSYVKVDISDYFGSIRSQHLYKRLYYYFRKKYNGQGGKKSSSMKLALEDIELLTSAVMKLVMYRERLPQGTTTSPMMSNFAGKSLDNAIRKIIGDDMWYGRYSDDMVIMRKEEIGEETVGKVKAILNKNGFAMNDKKTERGEHQNYVKLWGGTVDLQKQSVQVSQSVAQEYAKSIFQLLEHHGKDMEVLSHYSRNELMTLYPEFHHALQVIAAQLNYAYELASLNNHQERKIWNIPMGGKEKTKVEVQRKQYFNGLVSALFVEMEDLGCIPKNTLSFQMAHKHDPLDHDAMRISWKGTKGGRLFSKFMKELLTESQGTPHEDAMDTIAPKYFPDMNVKQKKLLKNFAHFYEDFGEYYQFEIQKNLLEIVSTTPARILKKDPHLVDGEMQEMIQIHLPPMPKPIIHALKIVSVHQPVLFKMLGLYVNKNFMNFQQHYER